MKLGLFTMNAHSCSRPDTALAVACSAEKSGFESLWAGEHVVMAEPAVGPEPLGPRDPILDPLISLAFLAAGTSTIRLATGILILPLRNPLVLAKQLASLDVLSKGRFMLGFGVGWLEPEFKAVGVPFRERGRRADEYLRAMIEIWTGEEPAFEGEFVSFSGIQARPQPATVPLPEIVVGGESRAALHRTISSGHGWFGGILKNESWIQRKLDTIREMSADIERPAHLGELEVTVSVRGALDPDRLARLAAMGVHRVVVLPPPGVHDEALVRWVELTGQQLSSGR